MGNFEILFIAMVNGTSTPVTWVIAVPSAAIASQLGYAAVGEVTASGLRLDHFIYAIPTSHPAIVSQPVDSYQALWGRLLARIGIDPQTIRPWYGSDIGLPINPQGHITLNVAQYHEPEMVGFFPWPNQEVKNE